MIALTERSFELVLANARSAAVTKGSACEAIGAFFESTIKDRDEFVLPWHGGPMVRGQRIKNLQSEVWQLIEGVVRRGVDEGSIGSGLTAGDVITFGAMLAQPLPTPPTGRAWHVGRPGSTSPGWKRCSPTSDRDAPRARRGR